MKLSQSSLLLTIVFLYNLSTIIGVPTKLNSGLYSNEQIYEQDVNSQQMRTIASYMDITVDPCEDFYNYACGNWKQTTNYTSAYVQLDGNYNQILVDIFENLQPREDEVTGKQKQHTNAVYEKALHYYKSCRELSVYDLVKFLPRKTEPFLWWKLLAQLQRYDLQEVMLNIRLVQHEVEHKKFFIFLSEHSPERKLNLTENVLKSLENHAALERKLLKTKLESYEEKLFKILQEITKDADEADNVTAAQVIDRSENTTADNELKQSGENKPYNKAESEESNKQQGETNKSTHETDQVAATDDTSEYLSFSDLQFQLPDINWAVYFDILLHNSIKLTNDSIFTINNVKALQKLIDFFNKSEAQDFSLYLLTHFLMQLEAQLPLENTAKSCTQLLRNYMPLIVNQLYEDHHYNAIRAKSDIIINNVFQRLTAKLHVMLEESPINLTKIQHKYLQRKNEKIQINIGNMPANRSVEFLIDYYVLADITERTNFYQNHLALLYNKLQTKYRILKAYQFNATNVYDTFDASTGWDSAASPYYLFARNKIIIPFAYLQLPSYQHEFHDVLQYSKLGWVLAHETMHGFDNNGLWYDAESCLNNFGETIMDKQEFRSGIACFKRQQTASISERIADVSGLHLLLSAYSNDMQTLTLSKRKLFFVNLAQYFCNRDTTVESNLKKLSHDQSNERVKYMLSNTPEFAQTFNCSTKSEQICRLW